MKRLQLIEFPCHVGLIGLGQPWMTEAHFADLMTGCFLAHDLSQDHPAIRRLSIDGINLLKARSDDYDSIRSIVGTLVQWLTTQSNVKIYNAVSTRLHNLDEQERVPEYSRGCDLQATT